MNDKQSVYVSRGRLVYIIALGMYVITSSISQNRNDCNSNKKKWRCPVKKTTNKNERESLKTRQTHDKKRLAQLDELARNVEKQKLFVSGKHYGFCIEIITDIINELCVWVWGN